MEKIIALIIALFYLIPLLLAGSFKEFFEMLSFLLIPLACIWFSDAMGGYTGSSVMSASMGLPGITKTSPPSIVKILGWILLLLPFFYFVILR